MSRINPDLITEAQLAKADFELLHAQEQLRDVVLQKDEEIAMLRDVVDQVIKRGDTLETVKAYERYLERENLE